MIVICVRLTRPAGSRLTLEDGSLGVHRGISVEPHARSFPGEELIIGLAADHRAVVAAQPERRDKKTSPLGRRGFFEIRPDTRVGRDAAGHHDPVVAERAGRRHRPGYERIADGAGEARGQRRLVKRLSFLRGVVDDVHDGCFQSRKRHVVRVSVYLGARQIKGGVVAALRQLVERSPARIGQAEHARDLVEAFPRRVVAGRPEDADIGIPAHVGNEAVPAGDDQRQKRRRQLGIRDVARGNVPPDMMDRDERHAQRQRQTFGEIDADEQRADEPRGVRDGDGVDLSFTDPPPGLSRCRISGQ